MSAAEQYVDRLGNGWQAHLGVRIPDHRARRQRHRGDGERRNADRRLLPIEHDDQIMLVTAGGQIIRCGVDEIGWPAGDARGVFKGDGEKVVSVERLEESSEAEAVEGPAFP